MIEERATVVRSDLSTVWVEVSRRSACAACASASTCGQKRLNDWFPGKKIEVPIDNPLKLIVSSGQEVWVGLDEGALTSASIVVYLFPLIGLILLSLLASFFQFSELFQIVSAMLGFISGLVVSRIVGTQRVATGEYQPRLLR